MLSSSPPSKIQLPFANAGTKNSIPVPSQIGVTPGAASYTDGFPPLTFTPLSAGGVPPFGADFNGLLNAITAIQQWQSAGGFFSFDAAFSTSTGGYPKGAILIRADGTGFWLNQVENNTANPDTGGANWLAFAPGWTNGVDTGAANACVVAYTPAVTALVDGMVLWFKAAAANTSATTLNVNGLGAKAVVGGAHAALQGGEIVANGKCQVVYNATLSSFVLIECTGAALQVAPASKSQHAAQMAQVAGVIGTMRNARMNVPASVASAAFTADEIIVETALGGVRYCLSNFNQTINLATVGAGGMDTGAAPASGYVALYAIYNPSTGATSILATDATSAAKPNIYSGANMPAGYTANALIGIWGTTAGGLLRAGFQSEREVFFGFINVLNAGTATVYTGFSLAAAVPLGAKKWGGSLFTSPTNANNGTYLTADAGANSGNQSVNSPVANQGVTAPVSLPIVTAQTAYYLNNGGGGTASITVNRYEF